MKFLFLRHMLWRAILKIASVNTDLSLPPSQKNQRKVPRILDERFLDSLLCLSSILLIRRDLQGSMARTQAQYTPIRIYCQSANQKRAYYVVVIFKRDSAGFASIFFYTYIVGYLCISYDLSISISCSLYLNPLSIIPSKNPWFIFPVNHD